MVFSGFLVIFLGFWWFFVAFGGVGWFWWFVLGFWAFLVYFDGF